MYTTKILLELLQIASQATKLYDLERVTLWKIILFLNNMTEATSVIKVNQERMTLAYDLLESLIKWKVVLSTDTWWGRQSTFDKK